MIGRPDREEDGEEFGGIQNGSSQSVVCSRIGPATGSSLDSSLNNLLMYFAQ